MDTLRTERTFDRFVVVKGGGVMEGAGPVCFFLRPRFGAGVNGVGLLFSLTAVGADSAAGAGAEDRVVGKGAAGVDSDGDGVVLLPPARNLPVKPVRMLFGVADNEYCGLRTLVSPVTF